jgi:Icc-related predicted phosphoesterase
MKNRVKNLWLRIKKSNIKVYLAVILVTFLFIQIFAQISFRYESFNFRLSNSFGQPAGTVVAIPPVGRLFFKTHLTPWQLVITLDEINFMKLEKQLKSLPPKDSWLQVLQQEMIQTVIKLFGMVIICGILGAMVTLLVFRIKPGSRQFWYGLLVSLIVMTLLLGTTIFTYDQYAYQHPRYEGVLASAPWVMNLIGMGLDNIETISNNLKKIPQELPMLYKQAGAIKNLSDLQTDLAVLHVSDIHNNPAAFELINQLVVNFKINFILDTGDLTDYGTPLEANITSQFAQIKVPYVFVPGNHDSPYLLNQLKRLRQVKILSQGVIKQNGLLIAGIRDPASWSDNPDVAPDSLQDACKKTLAKIVAELKEPPDLIAVHDLLTASDFIGKVPLIVHGHDHQYKITTKGQMVIDDAGTTGAAGLRGLTEKGVPYSATILYWKKETSGKLRLYAADSIQIDGVQGLFTITRHTFSP